MTEYLVGSLRWCGMAEYLDGPLRWCGVAEYPPGLQTGAQGRVPCCAQVVCRGGARGGNRLPVHAGTTLSPLQHYRSSAQTHSHTLTAGFILELYRPVLRIWVTSGQSTSHQVTSKQFWTQLYGEQQTQLNPNCP